MSIVIFLAEANFGLRVLSSPASVSVRVSVCVCINHLFVRNDQMTKFGSEMQNTLIKMPIILGVIDLDLQGQI